MCLRMIELSDADRLPIDIVVAREAVLTQSALVLILMAGNTCSRDAKVCSIQILGLDRSTFPRRNVRSIVALVASQPRVPAFERVSRVFVIEGLDVPLDQWKIFSVMFRVAVCALLTGTGRNVIAGVQALARGETSGDFGMAIQAFERGLSAELVASGAVGGPIQLFVRTRKRSGRDLRGSWPNQEKQEQK